MRAVYIGETSRALKTRTKEHSKAAACFDKNSQLAHNSQKTGHSFDFNTRQFFTSVPSGTSGCFWKRGIPIRKITQSMSSSISRIFRTFLAHVLCAFVTYLPILLSLVIFAYGTHEGHRSDRNVLLFKVLLRPKINSTFSLYFKTM